MWLCLNDAFLSFVHKDCKRDEVLVRARRPGDIEKIFPLATVTKDKFSDYLYRAVISREYFKFAMAGEIDRIIYDNFKNSVADNPLHDAYMNVWTTMSKLQPTAPYSGFSRRKSFDFDEPPVPKKKTKARAKKNTKGR